MIYSLLIILYVLISITLVVVSIKKKVDPEFVYACYFFFILISFIALFPLTTLTIKEVDKANRIKAQIILMKPLEKYREDIAIAEKELSKVERLIEKAFDKNNPNVRVKIENDVKIYSFLGSSDLGSAEAGNAKKQELLMKYIDKQNEIADRLIYIRKLAYGDEYYNLQQEYATYANNIFSGWIVRWFSIKEDYIPVKNQIFAPNDIN